MFDQQFIFQVQIFNFSIQYQLVLPILMFKLMDQQMAKNIYNGLFRREKDFFMQVIIENFITKQRWGDIQNRPIIIRQLYSNQDKIQSSDSEFIPEIAQIICFRVAGQRFNLDSLIKQTYAIHEFSKQIFYQNVWASR